MVHSDEELLADIRAVANVVDRTPSIQDYRTHGTHSVMTFFRRFGSWQEAVDRAGFEPRDQKTELTTEELIDALHALATELGESPTTTQMNDHGRYWSKVYRDRFGSWDDALDAAGLDPIDLGANRRVSDDKLLAALERLAEKQGDTPTMADMAAKGGYSPTTYQRHFGSWNAALDAADLDSG